MASEGETDPHRQRRYRVSGVDEHGDVHAFETDNPDSAEEMKVLMAEDLQYVELLTAEGPTASRE